MAKKEIFYGHYLRMFTPVYISHSVTNPLNSFDHQVLDVDSLMTLIIPPIENIITLENRSPEQHELFISKYIIHFRRSQIVPETRIKRMLWTSVSGTQFLCPCSSYALCVCVCVSTFLSLVQSNMLFWLPDFHE